MIRMMTVLAVVRAVTMVSSDGRDPNFAVTKSNRMNHDDQERKTLKLLNDRFIIQRGDL